MMFLKRIQIKLRARQGESATIKKSPTDKTIDSKKSIDTKDSVRPKIDDEKITSGV